MIVPRSSATITRKLGLLIFGQLKGIGMRERVHVPDNLYFRIKGDSGVVVACSVVFVRWRASVLLRWKSQHSRFQFRNLTPQIPIADREDES
jgi:hypothetical protein